MLCQVVNDSLNDIYTHNTEIQEHVHSYNDLEWFGPTDSAITQYSLSGYRVHYVSHMLRQGCGDIECTSGRKYVSRF